MTVPGASGNIPERDWGLSGFDGDQEVPAADFAAGLTRLPYLSAALRRRARLWITTAVIGLLLGAAFSVLKPAPFQASTSVLLTHPLGDDPVEAMQTDVALADSRAVAGLVVHRLGLTENATSFLGSYTVVPLTDRILQITVKAPTSDDAVRRAESVAFQFLAFRAGQLRTQQEQVAADLRAKIAGDRQHIAQLQARITKSAGGRRGRHRPESQAQSGVQYADRSREGGHRLQRQRAAGHLGDHRGQQGPRFRLAHRALPVQGTGAVRGGRHDRRPARRPGHRGDHGPGVGPAAPQGRRGPGARRAGGAERRPAPGGRPAAPQGPGRGSEPGLPAGGETISRAPPGRPPAARRARTARRWR